MGKSYGELMKELPKSEDLGAYVAKADSITAELELRADLKGIGGAVSSGDDWYVADVKFFTGIQFIGDTEGFSVTAHYNSNVLGEIFAKMKAAEAGIEEFLRDRFDHNYRWNERREVMRCILSLEDQTKNIYEERYDAKRKRNLHLYGKEDPREDYQD